MRVAISHIGKQFGQALHFRVVLVKAIIVSDGAQVSYARGGRNPDLRMDTATTSVAEVRAYDLTESLE